MTSWVGPGVTILRTEGSRRMEPGRARLYRPDLCFCCSSHHSHWEVLENGGGRFEWMVFNGERGRNSRRRLWLSLIHI